LLEEKISSKSLDNLEAAL